MNLFCDNKDCKYNMSCKCLKNDKECPYQKALRDGKNKKHYAVDTTNDSIQPLLNTIDLEKSDCEPVEMPTIPNAYVFGKNKEQLLEDHSIHVPKTIAKIKFLGTGLVIHIHDNCEGFIKPTKRQIKNLKKHFCIDVELMDEVED